LVPIKWENSLDYRAGIPGKCVPKIDLWVPNGPREKKDRRVGNAQEGEHWISAKGGGINLLYISLEIHQLNSPLGDGREQD